MLSLFKLPSWGKSQRSDNCSPIKNMTFDVWRKFLSRRSSVSEEAGRGALEMMEAKMESLQQSMAGKLPYEQYDLMRQYLREMDDELQNM